MASHEQSLERTDVRVNDLIGPRLLGLAAKAPIAAAVGGVLTLAGLVLSPHTFFPSYLFAFLFWFGVTCGSTAWLMGHHVTGGGWGFIIRRPLEAATRMWPVVFAMWVPLLVALLLSMGSTGRDANGHWLPSNMMPIYGWASHAISGTDKVLIAKGGYLNPLGWIIRSVFFFCIWFGLAFYLNKWSREEDASDNPLVRHRLSLMSAVGLLIYALTLTFATVDWVMSIEPHWFSSLWGLIFVVGQGHATLCLMVVLIRYLAWDTPIVQKIESRYIRDLGNFMLAFTLLWAYTNYSQFMIQYSGNIREEASWQLHRTMNGWQFIGFGNIIFHFAAPFLFLLMSLTKVNLRNLAKLALFLIFARHIDLLFYVVPTFRNSPLDAFPFAILSDIGLPLLLGGLWLMGWAKQMYKVNAPIVPQFDERLTGYWPLGGHNHAHELAHDHAPTASAKGVTTHG